MKKRLPVDELVANLAREEQKQKHAGGFGAADGLRLAVILVLRMADAEDESIEPTEDS